MTAGAVASPYPKAARQDGRAAPHSPQASCNGFPTPPGREPELPEVAFAEQCHQARQGMAARGLSYAQVGRLLGWSKGKVYDAVHPARGRGKPENLVAVLGVLHGGGLGGRLRAVRRARGLTLRAAADRTGGAVSSNCIWRLETNRNAPRLPTLEALCRAYGVAPALLLTAPTETR